MEAKEHARGREGDLDNAENSIRAERVALLFDQSFHGVYTGIAVGLLLVALLWPVQSQGALITWYVAVFVTGVARMAVALAHRRGDDSVRQKAMWEPLFLAVAVVYFLVWGAGGVMIAPADSFLHQVIVLYFLIGLAGSAVSVFAASRLVQLAAVCCLLLPIISWLLLQGQSTAILLALGSIAFVGSVLRSSKVLAQSIQENIRLKHHLMAAKSQAEALARIDELTGLYNRRAFHADGEKLLAQCERNENDLSLIVMDVDRFKQINDQRGHNTGDAALRHLGILMTDALRSTDLCGRLGGEEFGLLLPGAPLRAAADIAEKLRLAVEQNPLSVEGEDLPLTASFGVAELGLEEDLSSLLQRADTALYEAKRNGRNQVVCNSRKTASD